MLKVACLALVLTLITGCAVPNLVVKRDTAEYERIDDPPIGTVVTRGLGERLAAKGTVSKTSHLEAVRTSVFGEANALACAWSVSPGVYKFSGSHSTETSAQCFEVGRVAMTGNDGTPILLNFPRCPGYFLPLPNTYICKRPDGGFFLQRGAIKLEFNQPPNSFRLVSVNVETRDDFVQEFLYNGRIGNSAKFIYREFAKDTARPAFTQEAQYDLSDSKLIGFKGLQLEIVEASNTMIRYKLIRNF